MQDWSGCMQNIGGVEVPTLKCLEVVFANILSMAIGLALLALFVMFLIGGFRLLTAGGDQKAATGAKNTLTYAVLGIGLMTIVYLVFRILEAFTGVELTKFIIPQF